MADDEIVTNGHADDAGETSPKKDAAETKSASSSSKKNKHKPMSSSEKRLIDLIGSGDVAAVTALLAGDDAEAPERPNVNCLDAHGMTPLMHACHKAEPDLCQVLLDHGADVNADQHDYGYTALMFAAITGNVRVTELLLANGAKSLTTNSVGRNAAQMAAFVGQHHVTSFINNFIPREEIQPYTTPQGLETEPDLPSECLQSFHRLILTQNINPVNVGLFIQKNTCLIEHRLKVCRLLEKLCGKWFKATNPTLHNEARAIKMNYLACVLREIGKTHVDKADNGASFVKTLIKLRESDMFPVGQEKFIRQTMREFPYVESESLQGMIQTLSKTQIGHKPTALEVLSTSINGPALPNQDDRVCETCGTVGAEKRCAGCKRTSYCGAECQKLQWFTHKKFCRDLRLQFEKIEAAAAATTPVGPGGDAPRPEVDAASIAKDLREMNFAR